MTEMIATEGVSSHEAKYGRRVDGDFHPIYDDYGEVIDYKYNHKKCWFCGSDDVRFMDNDYKICSKCDTVINVSHTFESRLKHAKDKAESNRRKDARMRRYKYFAMRSISKESWQTP